MKKYIIGLGCSWTAGEGGWTEEIFKQFPEGRVQVNLRGKDDSHLRPMEHENSWVNVLCRDHFPDYTPMNLGIKGIGNTAAVDQLYFCDRVDFNNSTGIIVLFLSGFERWDMFNQQPISQKFENDGYSNGLYKHNKWRTLWPNIGTRSGDGQSFDWYATNIWSEEFVACKNILSILRLQTFAKAHGYKVILANTFNVRQDGGVIKYFNQYAPGIVSKVDWSNYLHTSVDYEAFMELLVERDGKLPKQEWVGYYQFYKSLPWPSTYLTNCDGAHPTIMGYKVIASEMAKFIKYKGYA